LLNVITNEYVASISKTKHSKLKESSVAGPRTRVEPAMGFRRQLTDDMDVESIWTRLRRYDARPVCLRGTRSSVLSDYSWGNSNDPSRTSSTETIVGRGGSLVDSTPFFRRVAG